MRANACVQADSSTFERHGSSFADKSVAVLITVDDVSGLAKEATLRQLAALGGWQQRWHVFLSTIHDTIMSICLGFVGPSGTGCQWLMHSPIVLQAVHVANSWLVAASGVLLELQTSSGRLMWCHGLTLSTDKRAQIPAANAHPTTTTSPKTVGNATSLVFCSLYKITVYLLLGNKKMTNHLFPFLSFLLAFFFFFPSPFLVVFGGCVCNFACLKGIN